MDVLNIFIRIISVWVFLVYDKKVLNEYNKIWNKIKNLFGKKFDIELVYHDKYFKTKIKFYNINFYDRKMPN